MALWVGVLAFVPLFLYDWVKLKAPKRRAGWLFMSGCLMLTGSLAHRVLQLNTAEIWRSAPVLKSLLVLLILGMFGALVHILFFSLPKETYAGPGEAGSLVQTGVYGCCRHPGFWPYVGCFICLSLFYSDRLLTLMGICDTVLNFLYICWQDRWVFPRTLNGYDEYRRAVPFLVPTRRGRPSQTLQ